LKLVSANAKEYLHGARAEISGRVIPETAELASVQQRCSAVLLDAANGTLNTGFHSVIICHNKFERNIVFGAIVDDLFKLKFLSIVCSQEGNLSANEGVELFEQCTPKRTSFGRKGHKMLGAFIDDQEEISIQILKVA